MTRIRAVISSGSHNCPKIEMERSAVASNVEIEALEMPRIAVCSLKKKNGAWVIWKH